MMLSRNGLRKYIERGKKGLRKPAITSQINLKVEATVNPSERTQKVIDAIINLFTRAVS
jgi:transcriptional regulator of met regulon